MKERKFISESIKKLLVTEYIQSQTQSAGFGGMEMKRTPFGTNITLFVNKPGLVIGRRGSKIQEITAGLEKNFDVESPQIEVKEVAKPDLNPMIVSKKIAISLEKGWLYRKAGNTTLRRTVENNAKGVLIKISGKLSGERGRSQKFIYGSVKYSGEPGREGMRYGFSTAKVKLGIIGISVRILDPDYKLPDQIEISKDPILPPVPAEGEITPEPEVTVKKQTPPAKEAPEPRKKTPAKETKKEEKKGEGEKPEKVDRKVKEEKAVTPEKKEAEKPERKTRKKTPAKETKKEEKAEPLEKKPAKKATATEEKTSEEKKTPKDVAEKAKGKTEPAETEEKAVEDTKSKTREKVEKEAEKKQKEGASEKKEEKKTEETNVRSDSKETGPNE